MSASVISPLPAANPPSIRPKRIDRHRVQGLCAFSVSVIAHILVIIILSLSVIAIGGGNGLPGNGLQIIDAGDAKGEELSEFDFGTELTATANDSPAPLSPDTSTTPITARSSVTATANALVDKAVFGSAAVSSGLYEQSMVAAMGSGEGDGEGDRGSGAGGAGSGPPAGKGPGARFFGTYAEGQRFVFVIDSSKSMLEDSRWLSLRRELRRALQSLSPDQEFLVISFDVGPHPMFGKFPPEARFLNATSENIDRLNRWVGSIVHGSNTLPASAIGIAMRLKPDAIFLLSDGEIRDSTLEDLRFYNRRIDENGDMHVIVPIHTVLLYSEVGFATLQAIADENDGVFTPVKPSRRSR